MQLRSEDYEPKLKAVNASESLEIPSQREGLNFSGSSKYRGLCSKNEDFVLIVPLAAKSKVCTYSNHGYNKLECYEESVSRKTQ